MDTINMQSSLIPNFAMGYWQGHHMESKDE